MAQITNNNAIKHRYLSCEEDKDSKPIVPTLRDKLLKSLVEKQLDKKINFENNRQKIFVRGYVEDTGTNVSGLYSHDEFQAMEKNGEIKKILSACELSDDEIDLLLKPDDSKNGNMAPCAVNRKLEIILSKLTERQENLEKQEDVAEKFNGAICLSRSEYEEECSLVPKLESSDKLLNCLIKLKPEIDTNVLAEHPINHLKELEESLFAKKQETVCRTKRKRVTQKDDASIKYVRVKEKPKSLWDMKECPVAENNFASASGSGVSNGDVIRSNPVVVHCKSKDEEKHKLDPTKPYVFTISPEKLLSSEEISSNRLSLSQLKAMDKFVNYEKGIPSSTLYIKNLHAQVSPEDLAAIFGQFDTSVHNRLKYRILSGRMRGQAFIEFYDSSIATAALEFCNGYILHGKPIVIQYGKKQ
ncbi:RNA-binding protein 41-like [Oratosquilla oratoria]|uniref:RNA-binding protein 41-like n=1 Tax=Oratosquilla oratoria TaxID=337810 RepID=UPI003F769D99